MEKLTIWDVDKTAHEAEITLENTMRMLRRTAKMLKGRLRSAQVDPFYLKALKKELRDFNMTTGEWKES